MIYFLSPLNLALEGVSSCISADLCINLCRLRYNIRKCTPVLTRFLSGEMRGDSAIVCFILFFVVFFLFSKFYTESIAAIIIKRK